MLVPDLRLDFLVLEHAVRCLRTDRLEKQQNHEKAMNHPSSPDSSRRSDAASAAGSLVRDGVRLAWATNQPSNPVFPSR